MKQESNFFTYNTNRTFGYNAATFTFVSDEPVCATCGLPVRKRDMLEHLDLHAQGL